MYLEYYIIENLLINYIIISCTCILIKKYNSAKKKWLGATLGAIYSVAYAYHQFDILFTLPFKILIMTFITLVTFDYNNLREYLRVILVFYLVNIFISGSTTFIIYFTGIEHMKISFLIICSYVSCELLKYIYKDIKMLKYIKELKKNISISLLNNTCTCEALVDSGNLLKDPISNNDVIVVKSKVLKGIISDKLISYDYENITVNNANEVIDLLDNQLSSRVRIIPFKHAAASKSGMLIGLKADYVEIDGNKISNVILGLSNFDDYEYDAILSPSLLQEV